MTENYRACCRTLVYSEGHLPTCTGQLAQNREEHEVPPGHTHTYSNACPTSCPGHPRFRRVIDQPTRPARPRVEVFFTIHCTACRGRTFLKVPNGWRCHNAECTNPQFLPTHPEPWHQVGYTSDHGLQLRQNRGSVEVTKGDTNHTDRRTWWERLEDRLLERLARWLFEQVP